MSIFAQYLAVLMLDQAERLEDEAFSGTFLGLSERITELLSGVKIERDEVGNALIAMNEFGGANHYPDPLTGGYWKVNYDNFRYYFIQESPDWEEKDKEGYETIKNEVREKYPILLNYAENGRQYAEDIKRHLMTVPEDQWAHLRSEKTASAVPAADRIVTLQHNQQEKLDTSASELVSLIEKENSIDGNGPLRDIVLGQVRAGRELIRAQTFRAQLLYVTLVTSLGVLIEKYGQTAIGIAASKLLELLIEQVFKS